MGLGLTALPYLVTTCPHGSEEGGKKRLTPCPITVTVHPSGAERKGLKPLPHVAVIQPCGAGEGSEVRVNSPPPATTLEGIRCPVEAVWCVQEGVNIPPTPCPIRGTSVAQWG